MSAARASISLGFTFRTLRSESASLFSWMVWMVIFHSFRRSRCLRPAALTRWRSAGWGGGSKIDGSGAGGAPREAPARVSAPELAELVEQPGPVDYASGTNGRVPLVFPPGGNCNSCRGAALGRSGSEERSVGQDCVSTCELRGAPSY